jgi:hypothetical protein
MHVSSTSHDSSLTFYHTRMICYILRCSKCRYCYMMLSQVIRFQELLLPIDSFLVP